MIAASHDGSPFRAAAPDTPPALLAAADDQALGGATVKVSGDVVFDAA